MARRAKIYREHTRAPAPLAITEFTAETGATRAAAAVRRSCVVTARVWTRPGTQDTCPTRASVTRDGPQGVRDPRVMWM